MYKVLFNMKKTLLERACEMWEVCEKPMRAGVLIAKYCEFANVEAAYAFKVYKKARRLSLIRRQKGTRFYDRYNDASVFKKDIENAEQEKQKGRLKRLRPPTKLALEVSQMPPVSHWPDREQEFKLSNSELLRWLLECRPVSDWLLGHLKKTGLIKFNQETKLWAGTGTGRLTFL